MELEGFESSDIIRKWKYPCQICGKKRHSYYLLDRIHRRMCNQENTNMIVVGDNRSGKSYFSFKLGSEADPNFTEKNILWDIHSLIKFYKTHKKSIAVLEEIGIEYDRQLWFTEVNKIFKYLLESQAYRLNCLIMNVPSMKFVPQSVISLSQFSIETKRYGKTNLAFIYRKVHQRIKGFSYDRYIGINYVSSPKQELIDFYEGKKKEWNENNLDKWEKTLEGFTKGKEQNYAFSQKELDIINKFK